MIHDNRGDWFHFAKQGIIKLRKFNEIVFHHLSEWLGKVRRFLSAESVRMLGRIIKKIRWADNNLISSFLKVLYYNIVKVNHFAIFEFDLGQEFLGPSLDPEYYKISVMDHRELARCIAGHGDLPREFLMHSIDGVRYCVVVTSGEHIAHISWIYLKGDVNRWFDLADDEAHCNYSFTFPEFRGKRLHSQAVLASAEWLKKRSYRRILMDANTETTFVLNSAKKIDGIKRIGTLTHWFLYRPKFRERKPAA
jgi:hypothetical protein